MVCGFESRGDTPVVSTETSFLCGNPYSSKKPKTLHTLPFREKKTRTKCPLYPKKTRDVGTQPNPVTVRWKRRVRATKRQNDDRSRWVNTGGGIRDDGSRGRNGFGQRARQRGVWSTGFGCGGVKEDLVKRGVKRAWGCQWRENRDCW